MALVPTDDSDGSGKTTVRKPRVGEDGFGAAAATWSGFGMRSVCVLFAPVCDVFSVRIFGVQEGL